ncbi:MAG: ABC transporter permease [Cyclobacteriaceae bacterium]|nr:ABC transporter permease [Cyclobacteriaceae bacterium]
MGIAIACCMSAYLLIAFNIEFDSFFDDSKTENMVSVLTHLEHQNGEHYQNLVAPLVMTPIAADGISGIKRYTRFCNDGGSIGDGENVFSERINFADGNFFEMFDFNLLQGSYQNFKNQKSIFLSDKLAKKLFAEDDPIDKTLILNIRNKEFEVFVGGVFEKPPLNSSFFMDAVMRMEHYIDIYDVGPNEWEEWREASALLELTDINQIESVEEQLNKFVSVRNEAKRDTKTSSYELIPFNEKLYEDEANWSFLVNKIAIFPLLVFMTLAFIILLIACFNLTNTTIALTIKRLKEIGVRKVVGARRDQVVTQFLFEMTFTIFLSIIVGLAMSTILVPEFAAMWGLEYGLEDLNGINMIFTLLILLFVSALLAGAYPALHNSKFKPVALLKGATRIKGTNPLTRILLVVQFSLSVIVLVGGVIFTMNADFQKQVSFGYDLKKILTVSVQSESEYNKLKSAIQQNSKIEEISVTDHHIGWGSYTNPIKIDTAEFRTHVYEVGSNYFNTMGLKVVGGRGFIEDSKSDAKESALVDESFVAFNKIENPIDTRVIFQDQKYRIVGVVQDHLNGLFKNNDLEEGHFYRAAKPEQYHLLIARVGENDLESTRDYIETKWKELYPHKPFESQSQEEIVFNGAMETNRNLTQIFLFITLLGCLLSASGIYSLANLNIEKRTKEIGIRKVLGATIANIIRLINKEFAIILVLAMIFGGLGGYFLTNILLKEIYATHIEVGFITVALCGLFVFIIGISTTSGTIFRAAVANPATTLRDE